MSDIGNTKRVFPGGNTSLGFYSFYKYVLPQPEARRIFIIKGGPGVGKSTFISKIAQDMLIRGLDIEYLQCSSDNDSLDGIVIPSIGVALIDGTAPHIVDPINPGAVDEIINLGEYWNESIIESQRDKILKTNKRTARLFNIAYSQLSEAKIAYDEWKSYIKESICISKYNEILEILLESIFYNSPPDFITFSKQRHLFASAITPGGITNYIDTLIKNMKIYTIEGEPGTGVKDMIGRIALAASEHGLSTELFHCPFEPDYLDMLIIPNINTAVINISKPFHDNLLNIEDLKIEKVIDLNICIQKDVIEQYHEEIEDAKVRFNSLISKAVEHLSKAKIEHDTMEKSYISSMDFNKVEVKRQEILQRILGYIKTNHDRI